MKDYVKPIVLTNEELAEGVYAASGGVGGMSESDCWTVEAYSVQDWNGRGHVFEVKAVHSNQFKHISTETVVTLTFSTDVASAGIDEFEFPTSCSGNTVTITRTLHANGYMSGDTYTYKVWVSTGDEATSKAISCTGASIRGVKDYNVQGEID